MTENMWIQQLLLNTAECEYFKYLTSSSSRKSKNQIKGSSEVKSTVKKGDEELPEASVDNSKKAQMAVETEKSEPNVIISLDDSVQHGVWFQKRLFDESEQLYHHYREICYRKQKKQAKPFAIVRKPPVKATFKHFDSINAQEVVLDVDNDDLWSELLLAVQENEAQSPNEILMKEDYVKLLNQMIQQSGNEKLKGAALCIFGSTYNGFGNKGSDLDLVILFKREEDDDPRKTNMDIVNAISKVMRGVEFRDVIRILQVVRGARVPIIKFISTHKKYPRLMGDISARNRLGPRNTKLMNAYAIYDERLRTLGYGIKKFAKLADINDASTGSLSSYAYLLMMIYYLQHTSPPVLPCLQDVTLLKQGEQLVRIENEMNTWYQEDLDYVRGITAALFPPNRMSIGELWKGFFEFYTNFDFRTQIDIRMRLSPTVRRVGIEIRDPFDEEHDLARVLRLSGENLIRNCFSSALNLFRRIEVAQKKLSEKNKLELFDWLVEQVANSHPYGQMNTCWLCGDGDHYRSVCHIFAERKRNEGVKERTRMRNRHRQSKNSEKSENSQTQNNGAQNVAPRAPNANRNLRWPARNTVDNKTNFRNGITLNDAMANYRQNNINRSLTPEVEYLMRMQAQAQYMGAQRYHFPQMGGRYPNMYQNLAPAQPMGYQSSRYYTQQQHTPPNAVELRFMRDPSNSPRGNYGPAPQYYQNLTPAYHQPPVLIPNQLRNNGGVMDRYDHRMYGRNQNRTFKNSYQNTPDAREFANQNNFQVDVRTHHQQQQYYQQPVRAIYQRESSSSSSSQNYSILGNAPKPSSGFPQPYNGRIY
ncbi:terminal uridylyltransferase 4-like isoform X2 [Symsagittifera roscoffensis]